MMSEAEFDRLTEEAKVEALGIWQNGSNDDVWDAVFSRGIMVAGELLEIIRRVPDYTVGDLTHEQVIASIERRYPLLGPPPHYFPAR